MKINFADLLAGQNFLIKSLKYKINIEILVTFKYKINIEIFVTFKYKINIEILVKSYIL